MISRSTLCLLLLVLLAPSCKIPFGSTGSNPFVQATGDDRPCTLDAHCPQGSTCCMGRCASCCSDFDCDDMSACHPGQCWDGTCQHDRPFSSPELFGAVEVPDDVRGILGMGSLAILQLPRTILVADLRVPGSARFISSLSFPGSVLGIQGSPPLVVAMVGTPGEVDPRIHVVDLSLPRFPRTLVVLRLDELRAADLDGSVIVAVSPDRIHLVDISTPESPTTLSRLDVACPEPADVEISGHEAVVACGAGGHVVVDLLDPRAPTVAASGKETVVSVAGAEGSWLLVGEDAGEALLETETVDAAGLLDFDGTHLLTSACVMRAAGGKRACFEADAIAGDLDGGRIYLVTESDDARLEIRIERLKDEQLVSEASMPLDPFVPLVDAAFSGRRAVLAGRGGGIIVVDAADPGSPRVDHSFLHEGQIVSVAWTGPEEIAVASVDGRLTLLDYSERSAPPVARTADRAMDEASMIVDMQPAGPVLAVTAAGGTLESIEHQGVDAPFVASSIPLAGACSIEATAPGIMLVSGTQKKDGLFVIQSVALAPDGSPAGPASGSWNQPGPLLATDGERLFDVVDRDIRVRPLSQGVPTGEASWVRTVPVGAFLWHEEGLWAAGPDGLVVIGDGLEVEQASGALPHLPQSGRLRSLQGGMALVTDTGVITAETSLPPVHIAQRRLLDALPPVTGLVRGEQALHLAAGSIVKTVDGEQVQLTGTVTALDPAAGLLLASMGHDGLAVLAPQEAPVYVQVVALDAASVPDGACVAAGEDGLAVVDLSDPHAPVVSHVFSGAGIVTKVAVVGLNCYAMQAGSHVTIVSLVDPATPKLVGRLEAGEDLSPRHLWSADGELVISEGRRLVFLDVSEPPAAKVLGSILMDGLVEGFSLDDGLAAASGTLTWFIDLTGAEPALAGSYDGPWEPGAALLEADRLVGLGQGALWTLDLSCLGE